MLTFFNRHRLIKTLPLFVVLLSIVVGIWLTVATWRINFWPTDAEDYYISTSARLSQLKYPSQMHGFVDDVRKRWLHGKEMFLIFSSIIQDIFKDYAGLRPLIFVCILATCLSAVLVYFVAGAYWGNLVGLACFLIFITSFWPYVYILFVKHQPLGMFYFLLALFFLSRGHLKRIGPILYIFSGFSLCLSIYSSTIASLYIPYYGAGLLFSVYTQGDRQEKTFRLIRKLLTATTLSLAGFLVAFVYFNYPNIAQNVRGYLEYVDISKSFNHFFYNQPVLIQWIDHPELNVRGGWAWVGKYFFLAMPVLFPFYIFCLLYLIGRCLTVRQNASRFRTVTILLIMLSFSSPILAYWRKVAQYGANYFTSLAGIIMLVGYALFIFFNSDWFKKATTTKKRLAGAFLISIFAIHAGINSYIFFTDVYPSRMATTFLSREMEKKNIREIHTYLNHPCRLNMVDCLDPQLVGKLRFYSIRNIYQVPKGYILVPPVTGHSVYIDVTRNTYADFDKDIYLSELFRKGNLKDYAVASFKTLSGSRIWSQEEEVLSYQCLILNQCEDVSPDKKKVWLLDAEKLQKDRERNRPSPETIALINNGVRNIGTRTLFLMDEGRMLNLTKPMLLRRFNMRLYKVGQPQDGLVAYVYRLAPEEPVWIPFSDHFKSNPVSAKDVGENPSGQEVSFNFSKPLLLTPGPYRFVIYRTGAPSDKNFYRIYIDDPQALKESVEAMIY
ncbi:MAG TPA: hypothetical protein PL155_00105 [Candidatus Omnitrophota bacterium]|nr:hypothetical protein [Candidatus Omnitrophota bacterium]HPD85111.1 hypothetical protein [Candidatus Omnitrophota bacterium]HRZ03969.1 hypothetical protein [Candidatus Omnitrophota bacterium]